MSLSFARTDITQTSQAERGCMVVLPLGTGKKQNKLGLGDCDGVIQALGCKKDERIPAFKTLPGPQPVMSLVTGAAPEQRDKLFASSGQAVRGINKKVRGGRGMGERNTKYLVFLAREKYAYVSLKGPVVVALACLSTHRARSSSASRRT